MIKSTNLQAPFPNRNRASDILSGLMTSGRNIVDSYDAFAFLRPQCPSQIHCVVLMSATRYSPLPSDKIYQLTSPFVLSNPPLSCLSGLTTFPCSTVYFMIPSQSSGRTRASQIHCVPCPTAPAFTFAFPRPGVLLSFPFPSPSSPPCPSTPPLR